MEYKNVPPVFDDEESARKYLETLIWKGRPKCRECGGTNTSSRSGIIGFYRCNRCRTDFSVRSGTILAYSNIPLHKWLLAIHLFFTTHHGLKEPDLAQEIGVTLPTAKLLVAKMQKTCFTPTTGRRRQASFRRGYSFDSVVSAMVID